MRKDSEPTVEKAESGAINVSNWNHSICDDCWYAKNPDRDPVAIIDAEVETCCFCGEEHVSGINIRQDPKTLDCEH